MHSLIEFGGRYIYSSDGEDTKYNKICSEHIDSTIRSYFIKIMTLSAAFTVGVLTIVYMYLVHGIRTTVTEFKYPLIAEDSDAAFIANASYQYVIALLGFPGYIGMEVVWIDHYTFCIHFISFLLFFSPSGYVESRQ